MHHLAFEARDVLHLRDLIDHVTANGHKLEWGLGRHGPGHNLFSYHRDAVGNLIEIFTELDTVSDEDANVFDPRPWHEDTPQRPKVWHFSPDVANQWGPIGLRRDSNGRLIGPDNPAS
jgi:hypothetical protein